MNISFMNPSVNPARVDRPVAGETPAPAAGDTSKGMSANQFASLLALLSAGGPQVRADLVKQLPADSASLVDRLLEGANPNGVAAEGTNNVLDFTAFTQARSARLDARVALLTSQMTALGVNGDESGASMARGSEGVLQALSRVSRQRGATVEQLLAVGDAQGADARATLDALLAQAGTDTGMRLATDWANGVVALPGLAAASKGVAVDAPVKDLEAVSPELQTRVARVIDRMKAEFGHEVQVVEGVRSQERQDWLYEQGRSRTGQVVTWTRDSAHTRGDAVDVTVDGSWDNAEGFARLQRIAQEEGLRTLGMKDPGHLELPRGASTASAATSAALQSAPTMNPPRAASNAAPANVAQVAGVAGVAGIAGVATTAQSATMDSHSFSDRGEGRAKDEAPLAQIKDADASAAFHTLHTHTSATSLQDATATAQPAAGVNQTQRIADIDTMQSNTPVAPLSRMTLNVDNANGTQETITVDLRGNTVSAQITTDAGSADRLRMKTADLQDALGRHGLETESVRISGASGADAVDGIRPMNERDGLSMSTTLSTSSADSQTSAQRERSSNREFDRQDDARREQTRARDEQQKDRQQEREQQRERFMNYLTGTE